MWAASPLRALPDPVSACCCVLRGWCMESIWPRLPWWLASRWVQPLGEALADVMMAGGDTRQGLSLLLSSWLGTVSRGRCILPWPQCLGDTCAPWPLVPETGRSCYPQSLGPRHLSSLLTPAHNSTGLLTSSALRDSDSSDEAPHPPLVTNNEQGLNMLPVHKFTNCTVGQAVTPAPDYS